MARPTSPVIWPNGLRTAAWGTSAAPHAIRHPQTQGKIERWHQTLKNRILLEHYYLPGDLEAQVRAFVEHYSHARAHESLSNLTPADVYFGRGEAILLERERIKRQTLTQRRLLHHAQAALPQTQMSQSLRSGKPRPVSNHLTTDINPFRLRRRTPATPCRAGTASSPQADRMVRLGPHAPKRRVVLGGVARWRRARTHPQAKKHVSLCSAGSARRQARARLAAQPVG